MYGGETCPGILRSLANDYPWLDGLERRCSGTPASAASLLTRSAFVCAGREPSAMATAPSTFVKLTELRPGLSDLGLLLVALCSPTPQTQCDGLSGPL